MLDRGLLAALALAYASGCGAATYPVVHGGAFAAVRPRAPLLVDDHLLDPPAADDTLLGRILLEPYDAARPLAEQLAENPCRHALVDVAARPLEAEVEDAAPAQAGLHVYYHFEVIRRVEKAATLCASVVQISSLPRDLRARPSPRALALAPQ